LDDVFASTDLSVSMPKYKMPEKEHDPRHAYQVVHDELMLETRGQSLNCELS
jgi:glutamate decarboxylase